MSPFLTISSFRDSPEWGSADFRASVPTLGPSTSNNTRIIAQNAARLMGAGKPGYPQWGGGG